MRKIALAILFIWNYHCLNAQQIEYNFINYSKKDGLASNTVFAIHKDRLGFMWFATEDGLNKFDGQNFTVYRNKQSDNTSVGRGEIMAVTEDSDGNLWVGTKLELSLYNRSLDKFINYDFSKTGWIHSLYADHQGNIWVGTYNGLFCFDTKTRKVKDFEAQKNIATQLVYCVLEDSKNNIWIGTDKGLITFNLQNKNFKKYFHQDGNNASLADNLIRTIAEDRKGNLWFGTNDGLSVLAPNQVNFRTFRHNPANYTSISNNKISKIAFDRNENLWVGTENGLCKLDVRGEVAVRINSLAPDKNNPFGSFVGNGIKDIYIANDGISWFSTIDGGVNKYDRNLAFFKHEYHIPNDVNGLPVSSVKAFAEGANGNIYIGTDGGGIRLFDSSKKIFKPFPIIHDGYEVKYITSIEDDGNQLLVATYGGEIFSVNKITRQTKRISRIKKPLTNSSIPINCLKRDSKGNLWIGTNGDGLYIRYANTDSVRLFKNTLSTTLQKAYTLNNYISTIEEDKEGNVWVGSNGTGILVYNAGNQSINSFNQLDNNIIIHRALSIYADRFDRIWISIWGVGLCLYNKKTKSFDIYGEEHLLSSNVIYKILEDNSGKLWLSTNKGISVFDLNKKIFKNFTNRNGIQNTSFGIGSGIKTSTGEMYFGGLDGFNYFNPELLDQSTKKPPLVITDLKINHKRVIPNEKGEISEEISTAKEIHLNYKQNFSLSFVALNYTAPHENQYSYKLDGFDKEWQNVGATTTASYTNLDPGEYTFRLKVTSEDNSWQTPEKTITIFVNPPFWRTYYAYFAYIFLIIASLWFLRKVAMERLKSEFELQQERLKAKLAIEKERSEAKHKMELEQVKIKFLTNLSHELKTPLTLILNPIENLITNEKSDEKLAILTLINRNAKRLLNLVNQLLDFRKMEENELKLNLAQDDFVSACREVFDSFSYISTQKNINLDFQSNVQAYITKFDKDKIERILINLLSNAMKFTPQHGNIFCHIEVESTEGIKLIVGDSGIGIPAELRTEIFERFFQVPNTPAILNQGSGIGLSIAYEFIKLHSGTIALETEENMGSIFTIHFPFMRISLPEVLQYTPHELINQSEFAILDKTLNDKVSVSKPTILVVDDSDDLRMYLKESLKANYKVIEASDGKQAWQKTLAMHPEIIISDVNMPNMDGIDLVKKLKGDNRTKHIPVVLLTVLGNEAQQLQGLEAGANDYLTKPFSFSLLNIKIMNLLELNSSFKNTYSKYINIGTPTVEIVSEDEKFLLGIGKYIDSHISDSELSIEELSQQMCMSRSTLYNKILSLTGESPVEYVRSVKLAKALHLLEKSDMKIAQIAYEVGFSNPNYFSRAFKAKFQISPTDFVKKQKVKDI